MRELSLHILDLAQNSISAGAKRLEIEVTANKTQDLLTITLKDNGRGMSPDFLERVRDPFTTTRTTRRVGLGIPMFAESARACDGDLTIESEPGKGTVITATFKLSHIDRAPMGDIASTLISIIAANPDLHLIYRHKVNDREFVLDTNEVISQLDGVPINEAPVLKWISEYVIERTSGEMAVS